MTAPAEHPLLVAITSSRRLARETKRMYGSVARSFLEFAGRDMRKWKGATVEAWRDRMEAKGIGVQTINVRIYALRFASQRLRELGAGPDFAAGAETLPPVQKRTRKPLTREEAAKLLAPLGVAQRGPSNPPALRDRAILLLSLHSGIRVGGLVGLDIVPDPARPPQFIDDAGMSLVLKGGHLHRTPPLLAEALDAVRSWAMWLATGGIKTGPLFRQIRHNLDGTWTVGGRMATRAIHKMVVRRADDAGLRRRMHPHLFRHTFVSWCRAAGIPDWQIALYTGHRILPGAADGSTPATVPTLGTYTGDISRQPLALPPIEEKT